MFKLIGGTGKRLLDSARLDSARLGVGRGEKEGEERHGAGRPTDALGLLVGIQLDIKLAPPTDRPRTRKVPLAVVLHQPHCAAVTRPEAVYGLQRTFITLNTYLPPALRTASVRAGAKGIRSAPGARRSMSCELGATAPAEDWAGCGDP